MYYHPCIPPIYSESSTESGFSEFTHPDDTTMLLWMNETCKYAASLNKKTYIKCHCSTGQTCPHYKVSSKAIIPGLVYIFFPYNCFLVNNEIYSFLSLNYSSHPLLLL